MVTPYNIYIPLKNTVIGSFFPINNNNNTDCYLEVKFDTEAGNLKPGGYAEIETVIFKDGWKDYDVGDDYSFSGLGYFEECIKVTVYYKDCLVWGVAP